jgi:hypothetical protein
VSPTCPFCHAGITAHLAAHGGPCPSCFAEIPGEEAATNPGEEVLAQQQAEAQKRVEARQRRPLLLAAPIVLVLVGAAAWSLRPQPVVELVFDDMEFVIEPQYERWTGDATAANDATPGKRAPRGTKTGTAPTLSGPGDVPTPVDGGGTAEGGSTRRPGFQPPPEGGVRSIDGTPSVGSAGGGSADDDDLALGTVRRKAALLESKEDISKAVKDMLRSRVPRLQQCFERSLNATPGLAGKWTLHFVVGTDGKADEASATGQQMHDKGFEDCIVKEMSGWSIYAQLAKPWPVSLPVSFRNEG